MTESDPPPPPRRWRGRLADAAVLLCVAALGLKAAWGGAAARDADAGDECAYALAAAALPERGLPPVEGSPLYVLWDSMLLRAGVPPLDLSFTSWAVLATLLPVSLTLLVRALGGGRAAALAAGGLLLATTFVDVWPYPMHLATVVLLLGAAVAARLRPVAAGGAVALTLLTATYARPEFLYALALFVPVAVVGIVIALWKQSGAWRSALATAVVVSGGAAGLWYAFGSPKGEGTRSLLAFGQHYALNKVNATKSPENPWHQWEKYVRADFGDAASLGEAARSNRDAFRWHLETNLRNLPAMLAAVAAPRVDLWLLAHPHVSPPVEPSRHPRTSARVGWSLVALLALGLTGAAVGVWRAVRGRAASDQSELLAGAAMFVLVAAPAVAASLVIYPRFHYLLPTAAFAGALAAAGFGHLPAPGWWRRAAARPAVRAAVLVALAVGLAAIVPNRAHGWCLQTKLKSARPGPRIAPAPTPTRASVEAVRSLGLRPPVLFLDHGASRSFYAGFGERFIHAAHVPPGEGLRAFVARVGVGVLVVDPLMLEFPGLRDDPEYRSLASGAESDLFRLVTVEKYPEIRFAVRRDLLP